MTYTTNSVVPMKAIFSQQAVYHNDINMIPTIEQLYAMIETTMTLRYLQFQIDM